MDKKIKVVIGANFGDEGKGLMTDYFCHKLSEEGRNVINIRHNGGAQAAHNVVTPDGKQHVFSHFGAGSFVPHVATYLSEEFILNPILFCRELEQLENMGVHPKVYIDKQCRITTPYDMMLNQIFERRRGDNRHGSCGLGINETVLRYNESSRACFPPFRAASAFAQSVEIFLAMVREFYVTERLYFMGCTDLTDEEKSLLNDENIVRNYIAQLKQMLGYCTIVDSSIINNYDGIVFEGAQGMLLDTDYLVFAPHLTSSKTGSYNPKKILLENNLQNGDIEFCYVTRSYFTRHGYGPFPTECDKKELFGKDVEEKHNHKNEWQGDFHFGYFDNELFGTSLCHDMAYMAYGFPNATASIAVTHLDETDGMMIHKGVKIAPDTLRFFKYGSYGETRNDVKEKICQ